MTRDFIKIRLDQMLEHPKNWGGPEAYELQILLLIEMEMILTGKVSETKSQRVVLDHYAYYLQSAQPISATTVDMTFISEHLARFRNSVCAMIDCAEVTSPLISNK